MSTHGYESYRPSPRAESVLKAAFHVLAQYEAWQDPMTIRQVFYRLIQEFGYSKTEADYQALIRWCARSRRARQGNLNDLIDGGMEMKDASEEAFKTTWMIPFGWIRDDKGDSIQHLTFEGYDEFMENTRERAESFRLDGQRQQEQILEIWCEAGGMVPLMQQIGEPWTLPVNSGGGYDSVTAKHNLARRVVNRMVPTVILHVGDFDPSGEGMYETLRDDVTAMVKQLSYDDTEMFTIQRVALTEEQVISMNVETAPPKKKDARRTQFVKRHPKAVKHFGSEDITAQLEALTPPELRQLIVSQIEPFIDSATYEDVRNRESEIREVLLEKLDDE
jgi:hypothetical protein